jgi:hypothetical protein
MRGSWVLFPDQYQIQSSLLRGNERSDARADCTARAAATTAMARRRKNNMAFSFLRTIVRNMGQQKALVGLTKLMAGNS